MRATDQFLIRSQLTSLLPSYLAHPNPTVAPLSVLWLSKPERYYIMLED